MIKVTAKFIVKKEEITAFKEITAKLIDETRKEEGCIIYELFQDNDNEQIFIFVESWESMELINKHIESTHCQELVPKMEKICQEKMELHFMSLIK